MVPEVPIWNEDTGTPENVTDQHFGREHNNERNMTTLHECNMPIASRPHNPHCLRCLTKCKEEFEPTWPLEPKCDVATRAKMAFECGGCGWLFRTRASTRSLCRQLRRLIVQCRGSTTEPEKGRETRRNTRAKSPGSQTPGDLGTPEPSTTYSCESSRAQKFR